MNDRQSDLQRDSASGTFNRADRYAVNLSWLIKLRWVAIAGQLLTILFVTMVLDIRVMLAPLGIILFVTAGSNLILTGWFRRWRRSSETAEYPHAPADEVWPGSAIPGLVMTLDMLSLTTLLYSTGGLHNPFTFFFFVNLSLSALVVGRSWAWALNGLTIACFVFLIYDYIPIPELEAGFSAPQTFRENGFLTLTQQGAIVAFATCSSVIVYFMTRLTEEVRSQQRDLRQAEAKQAQSEKLEALGTLAAGAAHELATPLSTIAIVAREVEQQIDSGGSPDETLDDVRLIRGELDRCRRILDQMSADAGHATGESLRRITVKELIDEVLEGLPIITGLANEHSVKVTIDSDVRSRVMLVPMNILAQSIRGLVKNGVDATIQAGKNESEEGGSDDLRTDRTFPPLQINVSSCDQSKLGDVRETAQLQQANQTSVANNDEHRVRIVVRDFGTGMTDEVQRRMSDPFFTTKPVGRGMGLGVFLAIKVIQRLDGSIQFDSTVDEGTTVEVILPTET